MPANAPLSFSQSLTLSIIGMLLVLFELALLALAVLGLSRLVRRFSLQTGVGDAARLDASAASEAAPTAASVCAPAFASASALAAKPAPPSKAPAVELIDVDEPTAAILMAIVAHACPIPASRLLFLRIRGVVELSGLDETTAHAVMEQTALMLGKQPEELRFLRIRRVDGETA